MEPDNEFLNLQEKEVEKLQIFLSEQQWEFVMNTPSSSHMGGIWERQIKTVKNVLTSILEQFPGRLDNSSLRTYLYEVMSIVNSRPLTTEYLNDPKIEPLTPNHLLTMKSKTPLPPPGNVVKEDVYAKKRWKRVQYMTDQFWSRWQKEYLLNLQSRQKWCTKKRNLKVGDIVIMKEDDVKRNEWRLAKIVETIISQDELVRKVKIQIGD